jgi:hypothetical protein
MVGMRGKRSVSCSSRLMVGLPWSRISSRRFCSSFKPPQGPLPPDKDTEKLVSLLAKTVLGVIVIVLGGRVFLMSARGAAIGFFNPYAAGLAFTIGVGAYGAYRTGTLPKYRPWMLRAGALGILGTIITAVTIRDVEQSNMQMLRKEALNALETKGEDGSVWNITDFGMSHIESNNFILSQRLVLRMSARVTGPNYIYPQNYKVEITASRPYPVLYDWALDSVSLLPMSETLS